MVSPVADLTDVRVIKEGRICFRLEAKITEQILQHAHSTAERAIGWISLDVKPAFLEIGIAQFSVVMGAKKTWYCFCRWDF